jgi:hypothetical protein
MTKEEALKKFAFLGAVWFGNSKQHFAFSAYNRLNGWNTWEAQYLKLIDRLGYDNFLIAMM